MKLPSEFEAIRSPLLNRSLVPSLDTCVGELLIQGSMTHDATISELAPIAYVAHNKSKGRDM